MPTTLVTGADSLIGAHLARLLLERGDRLRLLVSGRHAETVMDEFGLSGEAEIVTADPRDARAMSSAMRRVGTVFHVPEAAPWRSSWSRLHDVHVTASGVALAAAAKAGVRRFVHTSSATSLGPAPRGSTADETQPFSARWGLAVISATHTGEQLALRHCAEGLPVVIALPGLVLGSGDYYGSSTEAVAAFIDRAIPWYTPGALSIVGADDVGRGLILAAEHGRPGERYLFGGRNFTTDRLFADLGRLTGVAPPALRLPVAAGLALARAGGPAAGGISYQEARLKSMWWAYRSTKARDELGWDTGHHEEPLIETIEWYRRQGHRPAKGAGRQPAGLRVAGFGVRRTGALLSRLRLD
ncbi:MAG: NAD-dependent epimerase/dehydratase family protein [Baekduia sp.]